MLFAVNDSPSDPEMPPFDFKPQPYTVRCSLIPRPYCVMHGLIPIPFNKGGMTTSLTLNCSLPWLCQPAGHRGPSSTTSRTHTYTHTHTSILGHFIWAHSGYSEGTSQPWHFYLLPETNSDSPSMNWSNPFSKKKGVLSSPSIFPSLSSSSLFPLPSLHLITGLHAVSVWPDREEVSRPLCWHSDSRCWTLSPVSESCGIDPPMHSLLYLSLLLPSFFLFLSSSLFSPPSLTPFFPSPALTLQKSECPPQRPGGQAMAHHKHLHAPRHTWVCWEAYCKVTRWLEGHPALFLSFTLIVCSMVLHLLLVVYFTDSGLP